MTRKQGSEMAILWEVTAGTKLLYSGRGKVKAKRLYEKTRDAGKAVRITRNGQFWARYDPPTKPNKKKDEAIARMREDMQQARTALKT